MDVQAGVEVAGDERLAGVDPDAHPDWLAFPAMLGKRCCACAAARTAAHGSVKAKWNESPCISTSTPPPATEGRAEESAVVLERPHVRLLAELLQQPCRALDVREEQGDRAARKLRHGRTDQA